ncbi:MAG TPA: Ldh family oxidoreductase [Burkholderiaceae bacterium]|nr:Ldh family oxidoreductase [Burkholderiaceae bacterium]
MSGQAYATAALQVFAAALYRAAGMDGEKAAAVARLQVLTDAMGRATHGLAMAPLYLSELAKGTMTATGEPVVVHARGVTAVWDGHYLPGLWLVERALHQGMALAADQGMAAVAIRRSHHIGCLAALVKQAADQGFIAQIHNSDPAGQRVAPFGGTEALFTPNPTAIGYPGPDHPVLVDTCASITTTSMTRQKFAEGQLFDQPWLLDAEGQPTRDPAVLEHREPRGSLQLVGGQDHGHKGFGMALMIEALSQGLSGHGRKDAPGRCGGNRPIDPARPVRLPGDQAAAGIALAARDGVHYPDLTWNALIRWAEKLGVPLPDPLPEIPR